MRAVMIMTVGILFGCVGCASEIERGPGTLAPGEDPGAIDLGPLEAPVLEEVLPTAKMLRVRWSLSSSCDAIDGERRTDTVTYIPVFTTSGTDTNFVDDEATENQTYTYRVRCVRGDEVSDYSNQLGGNPFIE